MTADQRDSELGRARVADDDELRAYYDELAKLETGALWTVANDIEPWEPHAHSEPVLWKFADLRDHVVRALDLVTPEQSGRRVVYLRNPRRHDVSAVVGLLFSGLQVMKPGERTTAHRHAASALRFIMEGSGAYTIVDGHRVDLQPRDFVLTPNGTWHDHGVDDDGELSIWQDGLDIPLANALEANSYEVHPDLYQSVDYAPNDSPRLFGGPGLLPATHVWDRPYSPLFRYRWDQTYESLQLAADTEAATPHHGVYMRFANPATGGHVMATMGAAMQMLRPGEATQSIRHTGNVVYQVTKGTGSSLIDGQRFDWQEKDIFCVPAWCWYEHRNGSTSDDACLFSFNDFPVMEKLGFWRHEHYPDNDGHQDEPVAAPGDHVVTR